MHSPAVTALFLAAFVAVSTFGLASASIPGGFSDANVNSIRVQDAAKQAVALLNADAARAAAHNLTVPVTLVDITHANVQIVAGEARRLQSSLLRRLEVVSRFSASIERCMLTCRHHLQAATRLG